MGNLADRIEAYLKSILGASEEGYIILQRGYLAEEFACAPSQINYVLTTRFTAEKGYLVESRRGGGGYLRIVRLSLDLEGNFQRLMNDLIGQEVSQESAYSLLENLYEEGILTQREMILVKSIFTNKLLKGYDETYTPSALRALMLKEILITMCRDDITM